MITKYINPEVQRAVSNLRLCFPKKINLSRITAFFDYFKIKEEEQNKLVKDLRLRGYLVEYIKQPEPEPNLISSEFLAMLKVLNISYVCTMYVQLLKVYVQ